MKIFILCGGFGTRLDHQGKLTAKTMIKIKNKPILMHIINNFASQGFNQFVLCAGHKIETIKKYFINKKKEIKSQIFYLFFLMIKEQTHWELVVMVI